MPENLLTLAVEAVQALCARSARARACITTYRFETIEIERYGPGGSLWVELLGPVVALQP